MDNLYIRAEFDHAISLTPAELDRNLADRIRTRVYQDLENKCLRHVGHIRTNSIEILSRQQGTYTGSHTTGNVQFKLRIRCMAAQPVKGARVTCRVTGKNNAGILASNYAVPFLMFIPKDADEQSLEVEHEQIAVYDTIEVEMLDWKLQAPPTDQYWIICRVANARLNSTVITRLPKEALNLDMLWRPDYNQEGMDNLRADLTGTWFTSLKTVRDKIDTEMKGGYLVKLAQMADPFQDFVLKAARIAALKRTRFNRAGERSTYLVRPLKGEGERRFHTIQQLTKNDLYVRNSTIYVVEAQIGEGDDDGDDGDEQVVDLEFGLNIWSAHIRKFINEFELLRPDGDYQDQMRGLIPHQVTDRNVSRAYYKLYEMLKMREESLDGRHIFSGGSNDQVLCMGEAPGGFINALLDLYGDRGNTITGVSISEDVNRTRVWGRLEDLLLKRYPENYRQVRLLAPDDEEEAEEAEEDSRTKVRLIGDPVPNNQHPGDILSLENQRAIAAHFTGDRQASFITGDGGAPHDVDTESEIHHSRLIFAEILLALRCQKPGGNFILKLFDITTGLTLNLVTILSHFYERVHLYKPKTSRLASSEKYIICMYFMPRDSLPAVIPAMEKILEDWNEAGEEPLVSLFINSPRLTAAMKEYNEIFMQKQTLFIRSGIEYAEKYNRLPDIEGYMRQVLKTQLEGSCVPFLSR